MLYELTIEEASSPSVDQCRYAAFIVEALGYRVSKAGGTILLPDALDKWTQERVHETSVEWDFAPVMATLSRYFPARIGLDEINSSAVSSVLKEWGYQVTKEVSR